MGEYWIPNANRRPVLVRFDTFSLLAVGSLFSLYLWFYIIGSKSTAGSGLKYLDSRTCRSTASLDRKILIVAIL
jgi:hypothetical protein